MKNESTVRESTRTRYSGEMLERAVRVVFEHQPMSAPVRFERGSYLQRELDSLRIMMPLDGLTERPQKPGDHPPEKGVVVSLPYLTSTLSVLFDAVCTFWPHYDDGRLPKSATVAHAIDERLGLKSQQNGEVSHSGQAYASAIRPDCLKEADNRHHCRPARMR